jgi:hypothetical protein
MLNWINRCLLMAALFVTHAAFSQEILSASNVKQCQSDAHQALIREAAHGLDDETVGSATERFCRRYVDCSKGDGAEYDRCVSAYRYTPPLVLVPKTPL